MKLVGIIAAGIVLAAVVLFFGSAVVAGISESQHRQAEQRNAEQVDDLVEIDRCRKYTLKGSGADCRPLIDAYRAKWNREP